MARKLIATSCYPSTAWRRIRPVHHRVDDAMDENLLASLPLRMR